ncbi:AraC family transcriptional regulator [Hydrogenophaga pseudoflava]|uniref:AraC family transcriptional regulator n=1 Tax=Hydrogenophaga pseudoflava TaxID=47421 RepID=UPI0027E46C22|nr:AraC family transcriptional regulator [Hydrogenophaga pseudoflava]MDQ7747464.1 AraC family transcriptional regulator [Hydrogenophaga pseudoflava]
MAGAHETLSVRHYGASPGSHAHDHFQILLGLEGVLELEVDGRGRRIGQGDGMVITPGQRHDFESVAGAQCLVLDSSDPDWARLDRSVPLPQTLPLARYLASACSTGLARARLMGPALLLEAWAPPAGAKRVRRTIDWATLQVWARQAAGGPMSVAELAARAHLSPAQFTERCRRELGLSPMAWLRGLRLDHARHLRAQGLPVAEVARRCGYRSPSALTAALRRDGGPTPLNIDD